MECGRAYLRSSVRKPKTAMTHGEKPPSEDLSQFIDGVRASQRNIVFPDTVRNGRSADAFLWRGSPDPSAVSQLPWGRLSICGRLVIGLFGLLRTARRTPIQTSGHLQFLRKCSSFVQQIGAWLFGLSFISLGVVFLWMAAQARGEGNWTGFGVMLAFSLGSISVGIRIFRNGFPRPQNPNSN